MPHFYIEKDNINDDIITISDVDLIRHLVSALRIRQGEIIKFIDENEIVYKSEILSADKKLIKAQILENEKSKRKLDFELYLAQSILRGDAQNLAISNAVQAGVKGIYPVISDNCAVKPSKNIDKFQKIADESFKQCERADRAIIFDIDKLVNVTKNFDKVIVFAEKYSNVSLKSALKYYNKSEKLLVVIGPEGGFSEKEFDFFKKQNYALVSLGNLIYKAPNAIVAGISNIIYELNNER
ncbi:MAG: 16S rRNA (uracil(1498)-N(3))-methyltransferase [Cyanobacteria bacterium SIG30]|nr:16S rRNA (uracil(1498)-N(3))-methyltransferase [Cyanobacteria bacterium SIG30]